MEKPLSVVREEFVNNLVELINNSGLPMFIVLDILKAAQEEVKVAAAKQYESEKKAYEESCEKEEEK